MTDRIPSTYRRLFATYPRAWRDEYAEVAAHTLLEVHAELGRTAPTVGERIAFALAGVARRLRRDRPPAAAVETPRAARALFDQTNGIAPAADGVPPVDAATLRRLRHGRTGTAAFGIAWTNHR